MPLYTPEEIRLVTDNDVSDKKTFNVPPSRPKEGETSTVICNISKKKRNDTEGQTHKTWTILKN